MDIREFRKMLFEIVDQEMTVRELRQLLTRLESQNREIDDGNIAELISEAEEME